MADEQKSKSKQDVAAATAAARAATARAAGHAGTATARLLEKAADERKRQAGKKSDQQADGDDDGAKSQTDTTKSQTDAATKTKTQSAKQPQTEQEFIDAIIEKVDAADNIIVTLSRDPSIDEMAAAIGLTLFLDRLGKHATAIYSGRTPRILEFLHPDATFEKNTDSLRDFIIALSKDKADHLRYKLDGDFVKIYITPYKTTISPEDLDYTYGDYNVDLVLALDITSEDQLDEAFKEFAKITESAEIVDITTNAPGQVGQLEWSERRASSVSELAAKLVIDLEDNDLSMNADEATAFLTGIVAETDRFANEKTDAEVMALAADLMDRGADQKLIPRSLKADSLEEEAKADARHAARAKTEAAAAAAELASAHAVVAAEAKAQATDTEGEDTAAEAEVTAPTGDDEASDTEAATEPTSPDAGNQLQIAKPRRYRRGRGEEETSTTPEDVAATESAPAVEAVSVTAPEPAGTSTETFVGAAEPAPEATEASAVDSVPEITPTPVAEAPAVVPEVVPEVAPMPSPAEAAPAPVASELAPATPVVAPEAPAMPEAPVVSETPVAPEAPATPATPEPAPPMMGAVDLPAPEFDENANIGGNVTITPPEEEEEKPKDYAAMMAEALAEPIPGMPATGQPVTAPAPAPVAATPVAAAPAVAPVAPAPPAATPDMTSAPVAPTATDPAAVATAPANPVYAPNPAALAAPAVSDQPELNSVPAINYAEPVAQPDPINLPPPPAPPVDMNAALPTAPAVAPVAVATPEAMPVAPATAPVAMPAATTPAPVAAPATPTVSPVPATPAPSTPDNAGVDNDLQNQVMANLGLQGNANEQAAALAALGAPEPGSNTLTVAPENPDVNANNAPNPNTTGATDPGAFQIPGM